MRRLLLVPAIALVGLASGCGGTAQQEAEFAGSWSIDSLSETTVKGVSPELIDLNGELTLFVTSLDPQRVWDMSADGSLSPSQKDVPPGADFTVIEEADGWRIYWTDFVETPQPGKPVSPDAKKRVVSATTKDFVTYGETTPTGIEQTGSGRAWGVPDTVVSPDGTIHMYWVDEVDGESREVLQHATSRDGVTFMPDDAPVMFGGYVDPYVLRADAGDWLMVLSTTPHPSELPQKIHLARSVDGTSWEVDPTPLFTAPDRNYLDPTAFPIDEHSWRIVMATSPTDDALNPDAMTLVTGVLTEGTQ